MTGTKLYCLVTEAHVYEQLAQGRFLTAARPVVELAISRVASQRLNYYTTRPHLTIVHVYKLYLLNYLLTIPQK